MNYKKNELSSLLNRLQEDLRLATSKDEQDSIRNSISFFKEELREQSMESA